MVLLTNPSLSSSQSFGKEMLGKERQITLPFNFLSGFIVVDLVYDKTFPLRFVFDTGAEHTILFKKIYADLLGTKYDQRIKIYGADLTKNMTALIARERFIQLENTKAVKKDIVVMEQNLVDLEEVTGVKIVGILGGEYFRGLVIEIDYKKQKITILEVKQIKEHCKQGHNFYAQVIEFYLEKYFAAKACPNANFDYSNELQKLRQIDEQLFLINEKLIDRWTAMKIDSRDLLEDDYIVIAEDYIAEMKDWAKSKTFV